MALSFELARTLYDPDRGIVHFIAMDGLVTVRSAVSRQALMDRVRSRRPSETELARIYQDHASAIQKIANRKYAAKKFESDGMILVKTTDLD